MAAVQLIPKMQAAEAMAFTYDNLGEVIQWLGSDFYALTDGSPVNLNGSTVRSNLHPAVRSVSGHCVPQRERPGYHLDRPLHHP